MSATKRLMDAGVHTGQREDGEAVKPRLSRHPVIYDGLWVIVQGLKVRRRRTMWLLVALFLYKIDRDRIVFVQK